jgi:hypothetical protein
MKKLILAALVSSFAATAYAQGPTCKAQADEKKLAGAALKSFMTKCEKDAGKSCGIAATEKKLKGAAKTSFKMRHQTPSAPDLPGCRVPRKESRWFIPGAHRTTASEMICAAGRRAPPLLAQI